MGDMSPSSQRNYLMKELATAMKVPDSPQYLRVIDRQQKSEDHKTEVVGEMFQDTSNFKADKEQ
jgi:hypothetical protein